MSLTLMISIRGSSIREQDHNLMNGLWVLREVIPEHVSVLEMGLRVSLLSVDEVRELRGVADEEDGGVVEYPVEVAFICEGRWND